LGAPLVRDDLPKGAVDESEGPSPESMIGTFDRHRPLLFSIAYRMLGGVADA
jgi:hypothetical protein